MFEVSIPAHHLMLVPGQASEAGYRGWSTCGIYPRQWLQPSVAAKLVQARGHNNHGHARCGGSISVGRYARPYRLPREGAGAWVLFAGLHCGHTHLIVGTCAYMCVVQVWMPYIKDTLRVDEGTVVIGHSAGADAALRYVTERCWDAVVSR